MEFKGIVGNSILGKIIEKKRITKLNELTRTTDIEKNISEIFKILSKLSKQSRKDYIIHNLFNNHRIKNQILDFICSMDFEERLEYLIALPILQFSNFDRLIADLTPEQLETILNKVDLNSDKIRTILEKMPENKRVEYLGRLDTYEKGIILESLSIENRQVAYQNIDEDELRQIIEKSDGIKKLKLAMALKDPDDKINYISQVTSLDNYIEFLMQNLSKNEIKMILMKNNVLEFENAKTLIEYISEELSGDEKIDLLYRFNPISDEIEEALDTVDGKLQYFLDIKSKDSALDIRILKDRYTSIFSKEQMRRIICYNDIQKKLIMLTDEEVFALSKIFTDKVVVNGEKRWENFLEDFIIRKNDFSQLINDIYENQVSNIDNNLLRRVMQSENIFEIESVEDLKNIDEIKRKKCDELIKSDDINSKKLAIFEKKYGHNFDFALQLIEKYGEDLLNFPSTEQKKYLIDLKRIIDTNDSNELNRIYSSSEHVPIADIEQIENRIEREFEKEFNQNIKQKENAEQYRDKNGNLLEGFYEAGTDFTMLIRAYGATLNSRQYIENYYESSVGEGKVKSSIQQSCSIIRWDMLGNAAFSRNRNDSVVFGYAEIKQDELLDCCNMDSSVKTGDDFSFGRRLGTSAKTTYYFTDSLINHTNQGYNEVNTRRKMPDYIVAFENSEGQIPNLDEIMKAREDFLQHGISIPVRVINTEACRKKAIEDLKQDIENYSINPNFELGNLIYLKSMRHKSELKSFVPEELFKRIKEDHKEFEAKSHDIDYITKKAMEQDSIINGTKQNTLLENAIKATEEETRTGTINEQVQIIRNREIARTQKEEPKEVEE